MYKGSQWRKTDQLLAISCLSFTISKWIVEAVSTAYKSHDLSSPLLVRAHSIKGIASSYALTSGVSLQKVWSVSVPPAPHTHFFFHFYSLDFCPEVCLDKLHTRTCTSKRGLPLKLSCTPSHVRSQRNTNWDWTSFTRASDSVKLKAFYKVSSTTQHLVPLSGNKVNYTTRYLIKFMSTVILFPSIYTTSENVLKMCTDCLGLVLYVAWCMHMIHGASFYSAMECIVACYMTIYFHWVKVQSHYVIYFLPWSLYLMYT